MPPSGALLGIQSLNSKLWTQGAISLAIFQAFEVLTSKQPNQWLVVTAKARVHSEKHCSMTHFQRSTSWPFRCGWRIFSRQTRCARLLNGGCAKTLGFCLRLECANLELLSQKCWENHRIRRHGDDRDQLQDYLKTDNRPMALNVHDTCTRSVQIFCTLKCLDLALKFSAFAKLEP